MRLSTDEGRDERTALATVAAATEAGVTVFDTARAYGLGPHELGHNERLLAWALRAVGSAERARIVTKGGMARPGGAWVPDGRAKTIRADCEASLAALDGLPIDLYLLHAPDPRTPWRTSLRALARLADDGTVLRVGVANVNRPQLEDALALAPIAAVQVALNPFDHRALRGGLVERCAAAGVPVIAHSPLGGPRRAGRLPRVRALGEVAAARDATAAEVALAWLLDLSPGLVAIPGARRPETARSAARAAGIRLSESERRTLRDALGGAAVRPVPRPRSDGDVVLVMGIPGAGKSRATEELVARGYVRLNRDERAGSLRELADALHDHLVVGSRRVVLDNTYLTRAARSDVVAVAARHGVPARCVWLDTPLAQAQVNLVERLLDRFGRLPSPAELRAASRAEPGLLTPTRQMRALRELEPPGDDEGFARVERVPFARRGWAGREHAALFLAAAAADAPGWTDALPHDPGITLVCLFDWVAEGVRDLGGHVARVARRIDGEIETAACPHGGGPPTCWCRPPLPGMPLAFARAHGVDPSRSLLVGTSPAHRSLAAALGARYLAV